MGHASQSDSHGLFDEAESRLGARRGADNPRHARPLTTSLTVADSANSLPARYTAQYRWRRDIQIDQSRRLSHPICPRPLPERAVQGEDRAQLEQVLKRGACETPRRAGAAIERCQRSDLPHEPSSMCGARRGGNTLGKSASCARGAAARAASGLQPAAAERSPTHMLTHRGAAPPTGRRGPRAPPERLAALDAQRHAPAGGAAHGRAMRARPEG